MRGSHPLAFVLSIAAFSVPGFATTTFSETGGEQQFVIPTTGIYEILAYGASGGDGNGTVGGLGAEVGGDYLFSAGTTLDIYVGQAGAGGSSGGGGGGGTFLVLDSSTSTPFLIAGGGGGAQSSVHNGGSGLSTIVNSGNGGSAGGTAGGGGGFFSGGSNGSLAECTITGGAGFPTLTGGTEHVHGGYGGGGSTCFDDGGGGGGYGGGNGGNSSAGGGGGSYIDPGFSNVISTSGENSGAGFVTLTAIPEPASLALVLAGLAAIAWRRASRSHSI